MTAACVKELLYDPTLILHGSNINNIIISNKFSEM